MSKSCLDAMAGIKVKQAGRLLEDLETISLVTRLLQQTIDNFRRDIEGMMNGNKENGNGVQGTTSE